MEKSVPLLFRSAQKEDIPFIVALLADDELGKKREMFTHPLPDTYYQAFEHIQKDSNQELIVVELEEEIVGTFQLSFITYLVYQGGTRAQIEAVRIHKDKRRLGLGRQMFEWAIQRAKDKGAHVFQLTTDKKRPEALQFYESLGFVASHEGMKLHLQKIMS